MPGIRKTLLILCVILCSNELSGQWLQFEDSTSSRLVLSDFPYDDNKEKDITKGDFDQNGWMDLVVVRKFPFGVEGPEKDLLLLNFDGVLEDKTSEYAPEFLTRPTDARDVFAGDMDNDGWIDLVLANTFQDPPVFYVNRGIDSTGQWLGFADSTSARFPDITLDVLQFCAVWGGDITGNGAMDLYFSNYAFFGGSQDVLLVNDGTGHFTDESLTRLDSLRNSSFGTSVEIRDMDNDGDQDIVKISTSYAVAPWNAKGIFILYNDGTGHFSDWSSITDPEAAPYMFTISDFNSDGKKDVYVVDDGHDFICMTTQIYPDSSLSFSTIAIPDLRTIGFGGNCKIVDLDLDLHQDLGICDVDISIPPCDNSLDYRRYSMMRNDGNMLTAPYGLGDSIWNQSAYDFEFIDIDNNGTQDVFLGLCSGYAVLLNTGQITSCNSYESNKVYVDSAAQSNGNGTSWSVPFISVQQALYTTNRCADLDTILVAEGTYFPSSTDNKAVSFSLTGGVTLLGGFPTGGGSLSIRDPAKFMSLLSSDIGLSGDFSDNSYHVLKTSANNTGTLDGFQVIHGTSEYPKDNVSGSGLLNKGNITLRNIDFSSQLNPTTEYVIYSTGSLQAVNCRILSGNRSILIRENSEATFTGTIIIE